MKSNPDAGKNPGIEFVGRALEHLAMGNEDGARRSLSNVIQPSVLPQSKHRIPLRLQAQVFARDNYTCGYCGCLTVCLPYFLRLLICGALQQPSVILLLTPHSLQQRAYTAPVLGEVIIE